MQEHYSLVLYSFLFSYLDSTVKIMYVYPLRKRRNRHRDKGTQMERERKKKTNDEKKYQTKTGWRDRENANVFAIS